MPRQYAYCTDACPGISNRGSQTYADLFFLSAFQHLRGGRTPEMGEVMPFCNKNMDMVP